MTRTDARACRAIIPDPSRPDPPHPYQPARTPAHRSPAPAGLPRRRPRSASRPWAPPPGRHSGHGRRRGAGRRPVHRRDRRLGRRRAPAGPGRAERPPRRPRAVRRPGRGHHPPPLARLDADALAGAVGAWLADREQDRPRPAASRRRAVAVDGKTLRGARTQTTGGDGRPVHLLAAMDHTSRAVLAQRQVGGAPEEVSGFRPLLAGLDLAATVITADALQTQREAAEFLVTGKQAHDLFQVKANQPTLLARCQRLPWHRVPVLDRTRDQARGRIEHRTLKAVTVGRFGFPHAAQVIQVTRKRTVGGSCASTRRRRWQTVTACAITSLGFAQASPPASPTCCAGTGPSRRCATCATSPSVRTPPRSAPAPAPTSWPAWATWSSGCCAGRGRSTSPPHCAATPATHADPSPPSGSDSSAIVRIGIFGRGPAGLLGAGHRVSLPAVTRTAIGPGAARPSGSPYPDPRITAGRVIPEEAWPD
jgi:hypothetical protein